MHFLSSRPSARPGKVDKASIDSGLCATTLNVSRTRPCGSLTFSRLAMMLLFFGLLVVHGSAFAQAPNFDPFDESAPLNRVEAEYQKTAKLRDAIKDKPGDKRSPEEMETLDRLTPYLTALKALLVKRGSKIFDKSNATKSSAQGTTKTPATKASESSTPDTGFRFGGLQFGGKPPKSISGDPHGIGASWYIIDIDINITKNGDQYTGTLRDAKLLAYSRSFMSQTTTLGLATAAHELAHVEQYKYAWEHSYQALREKLANVSGKSREDVKKAVKKILDDWFGPEFNYNFTGRARRDDIKKKYMQAANQKNSDSSELPPPLERAPKTAEYQFEHQYKGKDKEAADEIKKRSDSLKTSETPPDVTPNGTIGHGTVRVRIRLFEGDKEVSMVAPAAPAELGVAINHGQKCRWGETCCYDIQVENKGQGTWNGPISLSGHASYSAEGSHTKQAHASWTCRQLGSTTTCISVPISLEMGQSSSFQQCIRLPRSSSSTAHTCVSIIWPGQRGGDKERDTVRAVQLALAQNGYDPGAPDGRAGHRTEQAIGKFRSAKGLPPDDGIDKILLGALFGDVSTLAGDANAKNDSDCDEFRLVPVTVKSPRQSRSRQTRKRPPAAGEPDAGSVSISIGIGGGFGGSRMGGEQSNSRGGSENNEGAPRAGGLGGGGFGGFGR